MIRLPLQAEVKVFSVCGIYNNDTSCSRNAYKIQFYINIYPKTFLLLYERAYTELAIACLVDSF